MNRYSNVPPGLERHPDAPWMQVDPEFTVFETCYVGDCESCDRDQVPLDDMGICEECFKPREVEYE